MKKITNDDENRIDGLVRHFVSNRHLFESLLGNLDIMFGTSPALHGVMHSRKGRIKDPEHLRDKLRRKFLECQESKKPFPYTKENLFLKVNDLVGFRVLHLYTHQFESIHKILVQLFDENRWIQIEKAKARTWDDESRDYFQRIGIATTNSKTMYTSVHYVLRPNRRLPLTCEIQVRTLMEEVWGEVDHQINYPHPSVTQACREQIKVLARMTSGCSRLVDSIFLAHRDAANPGVAQQASQRPAKKRLLAPKVASKSPR